FPHHPTFRKYARIGYGRARKILAHPGGVHNQGARRKSRDECVVLVRSLVQVKEYFDGTLRNFSPKWNSIDKVNSAWPIFGVRTILKMNRDGRGCSARAKA